MGRRRDLLPPGGRQWLGELSHRVRDDVALRANASAFQILEMYLQRAGYRPGAEQFAAHARRRFRLTPPKAPHANAPQVDPSLWIVHYGPADSNDRIPTTHIPFDQRTHAIMATRAHLQRAGQISRKEFMLSDRVNWPQIPLPREGRGQQVYATQAHPRPVPQQMAYPPHGPGAGGPPSKRPRHAAGSAAQHPQMVGGAPPMDNVYDDEEDTSRGDMFDHLTPREVSAARYTQNHEWMDEILSSPYRLGQITPADLNLGLHGDLSALTKGIFEAQAGDATRAVTKKPYVGRLDAGLADDFRKRVAEKIETTNAEIEEMKAEHAKMLAHFRSHSVLKQAEQDVRVSLAETGSEFWRLEGRQEESDEGAGKGSLRPQKALEAVISEVEVSLGREIVPFPDVVRKQDGGYQEPAPEPIPEPTVQPPPAAAEGPAAEGPATEGPATEGPAAATSTAMSRQVSHAGSQDSGMGGDDIDMGGTAAGLLDQMHPGSGFSPTSTPNNFPTPQPQASAIPSSVATPAHIGASSPQVPPPTIPEEDAMEGVKMEHDATAEVPKAEHTGEQGGGGGGGEDWVVVPKGGVSPDPSSDAAVHAPQAPAQGTSSGEGAKPASATSVKGSAAGTPAVGDLDSVAFDGEGDNNDFSSLGDLDTAADALASFDGPALDGHAGGLGEGLDLNMDMEDSAFGDAFHGVNEARHEDGNTPADGL